MQQRKGKRRNYTNKCSKKKKKKKKPTQLHLAVIVIKQCKNYWN